jgi:hypothetical protein
VSGTTATGACSRLCASRLASGTSRRPRSRANWRLGWRGRRWRCTRGAPACERARRHHERRIVFMRVRFVCDAARGARRTHAEARVGAYHHVRVETPYGFGEVVSYDEPSSIVAVRLPFGVGHLNRNALLSTPPDVPRGVLVATPFGGGTVVRRRSDDGVYVVALTTSPGPPMAYLSVSGTARADCAGAEVWATQRESLTSLRDGMTQTDVVWQALMEKELVRPVRVC